MPDRAATLSALSSCFADFEALVRDLSDHEWGVQSLCPDWTVRDVATHLVGIETVISGWRPTRDDEPPPFDRMGAFMAEAASMSNAQLRDAAIEVLGRRGVEIAALTPDEWNQRCMTPAGPRTLGGFMEVRIFDFWIHQRDMCVPLGRATNDGGPAAEITLDEVHNSLGYVIGKKVGLPDGMSVVFHLTGSMTRSMYVEVDGRARVVESLDRPADVEVSADSTTFLLLAAGRIDADAEIDAERIGWTGDDQWGSLVAHNLAYTI